MLSERILYLQVRNSEFGLTYAVSMDVKSFAFFKPVYKTGNMKRWRLETDSLYSFFFSDVKFYDSIPK